LSTTRFSFRALLKDIRPVWMSAVGSLTASIVLVEFSHTLSFSSNLHHLIFAVTALVAVVLPGVLVVFAIRKTFRFESRTTLLGTILACYFFVTIVFAGFYYGMAAVGDLKDAEDSYEHYRAMRVELEEGTRTQAYPRSNHMLYFEGIGTHLWVALNDCLPENIEQRETHESLEHLMDATRVPFRECLEFDGGNRFPVFMACLHFSIVTMTTLGYGDITPVRTFSRIVADLQILASVSLFTLGLGMVFGGLLDRET